MGLINVRDEDDRFDMLQNVEITVKDSKVVYYQYVSDPTIDNDKAVNDAYKWVDEHYYGK